MRMRRNTKRLAVLILLAAACAAGSRTWGQQSASYSAKEYVFNAGGNPSDGVILTSTSYRIGLDAVGEGLIATSLSSSSFQMDAGFVGVYPPPGETTNLRFTSPTSLIWSPEPSAGLYNVYRDVLTALPGNFGVCFQPDLATTSGTDATDPAPGVARFYLVTAENRLDEEGTKGFRSSGAERPNPAPCP